MGDTHSVDDHKNQTTDRRERVIGVVLLVLGLALAGGALAKIEHDHLGRVRTAQLQPNAAPQSVPVQSTPDQTRPTTPAPQPAQPQVQPGVTTGSAPLTTQDRPPQQGQPLPPAPAEKIAPPINTK
jgi:hypothetical protein